METNLKAIELRDLWRRYKDERDEKGAGGMRSVGRLLEAVQR